MIPARHLFPFCLPLLLVACAPLPPAARPSDPDDDAPILRIANMLSQRGPVSANRPAPVPPLPAPAPPRVVAAAPPAKPLAGPAANAVPGQPAARPPAAPVAAAPPPVQEWPLQTLPNREVAALLALSDAAALGPIVEMPVPPSSGSLAYTPVLTARPAPPPPRPVHCKAVRSREAGEEKIAISCGNTGKVAQAVFLQIDAMGMDGVPPPAESKSGFVLPPGKTRQLAMLTTVARPAKVDIYFTHEARP
ncbi:MAG: hypothetical protein V4562_09910 [Pseudomonadota bacterium]